jgi:ribonucleoside-diphosphate reductase beta chain
MTTDTDVARSVEAAGLKDMTGMNVDNVYTLMDVQLRERPGPRELYRRWEKQNWAVYDLDWTQDKVDWDTKIPNEFKQEIMFGLRAFFMGEVCVTETLSPMVHAAPTTEDQQFLSTQLVDEARHAIFFDEFFRNVLGIEGVDAMKSDPLTAPYMDVGTGYGKTFFQDLPNVTEAVREDPADYKKWVTSIVLYHMLIEGMLALYGQRQLLQATRLFDVLPSFRAGFTAVTRDESRHVNYGVYALRKAYEAGLHDHIVESARTYMDGPCDLLTKPLDKIVLPPEEMLALVPEEMRAGNFFEEWDFPLVQLRKRLGGAGIRSEAIDSLDQFWWSRVARNVAEYEQRFGEPHPATERDAEGYARLRERVAAHS